MRPRVRSYGDNSTRTRSPGRIRMKFIRSLPLMCANTRWPFSSSTANIVLGSGSITVPSTSIASFLATGVEFPFLVSNAGPEDRHTNAQRIKRPAIQQQSDGPRERHQTMVRISGNLGPMASRSLASDLGGLVAEADPE